ncbi:MAG: DNA/RNA nuclease SfsA [Planctomycetes bacterium]|nr:DNA/RNA nuclease SfsA [Planctomycetota bacterium]
MQIEQPTVQGRLIKRYKRFLADVEMEDGSVLTAHCPNTGSLKGCLEAGSMVVLRDSQNPARKLQYTLQTIQVNGTWVNVDTGLPEALAFEAIQAGLIQPLTGYASARREVKYGKNSRIDVLLEDPEKGRCYVEVKNTTLVDGSRALFPDAVTERGRKHLYELASMVEEGHRAAMLFVVSRDDVKSFSPAEEIDPAYTESLREVAARGVEVLAYSTRVEPDSFQIHKALKIAL